MIPMLMAIPRPICSRGRILNCGRRMNHGSIERRRSMTAAHTVERGREKKKKEKKKKEKNFFFFFFHLRLAMPVGCCSHLLSTCPLSPTRRN